MSRSAVATPSGDTCFRVPRSCSASRTWRSACLLRLMGMASVEHQKAGRHTALAANLACVAGALFLQFPPLGVVVLTNLGTLASYLRAAAPCVPRRER